MLQNVLLREYLALREQWRHLLNGEVNVLVLYCVTYTNLIERQTRHISHMKEIKNKQKIFKETGENIPLGSLR